MENKHTEGQLYSEQKSAGCALWIDTPHLDKKRVIIASVNDAYGTQKANAARIVTCWNEHDHLTEQVKQLQEENKKLVAALADIYNEIPSNPKTALVKIIKEKILELDIPKKA